MLAKRLPTILPEMTFEESIETTKIYSVAGELEPESPLISRRPFRSPHHTVSSRGISGGGTIPRPGEISLAHNGVLFLDELPEFGRDVMETMRQPLEDGKVTISRVAGSLTYPSAFTLVAAMNPCPCGFYGHLNRKCTCTPQAVRKYLNRISGPMLDRLDLHIEVPPVDYESLKSNVGEESSQVIRERVNRARAIQNKRYEGTGITCNARLLPGMLNKFCKLTPQAETLLKSSFERLGLSARAYDRILKVARTIADIEGKEDIDVAHIAQAIQFRSLDRKYFGG
jgi:magnesium chelatase family protein